MNTQRLIEQTEFNRDFVTGRNAASEIYNRIGGDDATFEVWLHGAEYHQEGMPLDDPYLEGLWAFLHFVNPAVYSAENGVIVK